MSFKVLIGMCRVWHIDQSIGRSVSSKRILLSEFFRTVKESKVTITSSDDVLTKVEQAAFLEWVGAVLSPALRKQASRVPVRKSDKCRPRRQSITNVPAVRRLPGLKTRLTALR
jgi:hypothetical protein